MLHTLQLWRERLPRLPRWARCVLWTAAFLLPAIAALGWMGARFQEDQALRQAAARLDQGAYEDAAAVMQQVAARPFLTPPARRRAAELLCRLGYDGQAQRLLRGLRFLDNDPQDRRIRALGARAQKAAVLLARAERTAAARERLKLAQEAQILLPEAPRVLQRVVLERLLVLSESPADAAQLQQFEEEYTALARHAPALAAEVLESARRLQGAPAARH